ncbi:hypothetical protein KUCAC02_023950 [Chaenocephalus aceratus]|uniref:Uncharacterized protein n=1 Tax=Chaenocephalus aceratus TaxID=36190 RepID=A0ACB9WGE1_CHAAC|nr:hypothetical protein KUCAC02_023950 [Chaenocephalus aceratus]
MTTALQIFRSLCTVLIGKHNSNTVLIHLKAMKDFIKECRIPDMEEGDKLGDSPLTQEEDDEERRNAHTIVGRSPFTYEFRKVMEELLLKTLLPKDISQSKEGWAKRDGAKPRTSSSKYDITPDILPVPKRAKLTLNTGEDIQSSTDVENSSNDPTSKGSKPATEYLHALSNHMYVIDPLQGSNEVEDSRKAGYKFGEYFKMRQNRLGKEDWVSIKWQPGKITHTFQKDATSCRAFVMQMAKMTVKEFPKIPKTFHIKSSQHLRRDMAEEILRGSVSKDDFCSFCGIEDLPTTAVDAVWIQCETCGRWFHTQCLGNACCTNTQKRNPVVLCVVYPPKLKRLEVSLCNFYQRYQDLGR